MSVKSKPKRHHYVPRAYLELFGRSGRVAVRRRGVGKIVIANAINVAVEGGFYETQGPEGQKSVVVENELAKIDTEAVAAVKALIEAGDPPMVGSAEQATLAVFIAVQITRTPEMRERVLFPSRVVEYAKGRDIDAALMAEYLEKVHLGFRPSATEVRAALDFVHGLRNMGPLPTKDEAIQISLDVVDKLAAGLLQKRWTLEVARKPRFLTSDTPVVIWRKPSPRDRFEGVGINNAEEVRFPLDSGNQLVLVDRPKLAVDRVEPARVRQCNLDIASGCHNFIVGHPDRLRQLQEIPLGVKRPVLRFNTGPGYRQLPDGTDEYVGEILHMWVQRHDLPAPPQRRR